MSLLPLSACCFLIATLSLCFANVFEPTFNGYHREFQLPINANEVNIWETLDHFLDFVQTKVRPQCEQTRKCFISVEKPSRMPAVHLEQWIGYDSPGGFLRQQNYAVTVRNIYSSQDTNFTVDFRHSDFEMVLKAPLSPKPHQFSHEMPVLFTNAVFMEISPCKQEFVRRSDLENALTWNQTLHDSRSLKKFFNGVSALSRNIVPLESVDTPTTRLEFEIPLQIGYYNDLEELVLLNVKFHVHVVYKTFSDVTSAVPLALTVSYTTHTFNTYRSLDSLWFLYDLLKTYEYLKSCSSGL